MDSLVQILTLLAVVAAVAASVAWLRARRREQRLEREQQDVSSRLVGVENQLLQARRMEAVGILAGSVVHNLNNLLAVILGNARLATQSLPTGHEARDSMDKVVNAGNLAGELVATLFHFPVAFSLWIMAISVGVATAVGIGFGLYPAWIAARMDPVEALRG